jgi:hypothetical protein
MCEICGDKWEDCFLLGRVIVYTSRKVPLKYWNFSIRLHVCACVCACVRGKLSEAIGSSDYVASNGEGE